ncbi:MAG TPA: MarR family transcriptional regulator [Allosphingosinicella sp.]|jgi:DNA-binding MarR family transcriptional regulator
MDDGNLAAALATGAVTIVRRLRAADRCARLSGPQASALGVIIHAGSIRMSQLARLEEVGRPAITKTVAQLEALGLVIRRPDDEDGRVSLISATTEGKRLFQEGHARRSAPLAAAVGKLDPSERATLVAAIQLIKILGESIGRAEDSAGAGPLSDPV